MKAICMFLVLASVTHGAEPLHLTDGQTFQNWSVIGESDTTVTIKHSKGGAKVSKSILPKEVLEKYPITEPQLWVPPELPPELDGIEKGSNGERSITIKDKFKRTLKWTFGVASTGARCIITRTSESRTGGETKTDYLFFIEPSEIPPFQAGLTRALEWSALTRKENPPPFEKNMGEILGKDWQFHWTGEYVFLLTGVPDASALDDDDMEQLAKLLTSARHIFSERIQQNQKAEDFAAKLK